MTIKFALAFTSHEIEDRVIEILCQEGFDLLFRAMTLDQLSESVKNVNENDRLVILTEEKIEVEKIIQKSRKFEYVNILSINFIVASSKENLLSVVNNAMRYPVLEPQRVGTGVVRSSWIAVTGLSSSPGRTTIALNIAAEIANTATCLVVDADSSYKDLHLLLGTRCEGQSILTPSLTYMGLTHERDQMNLDASGIERCVLDIGQMPFIEPHLMTDRRKRTRETLDLIFESRQIVYVLQPHHRALMEMEGFLEFTERELTNRQIIFVINKVGNSLRGKSLVKSVKNRIGGKPCFVVPRDDTLFDRAQGRYASISEVGSRTHVRKALQEISGYLANSI